MPLENLVQELKKRYPAAQLEEEEGIWRFSSESGDMISLEPAYDSEDFYLYSVVAEIGEKQESEQVLRALEGNLFGKETGTASLGYIPSKRLMVLFDRMDRSASIQEVDKRMDAFLGLLAHWKRIFSTIGQEEGFALERHLMDLQAQDDLKIFFA